MEGKKLIFGKEKEQNEEEQTLWFIDELQKRLDRCKSKQEKDIVVNIVLDRLGHKHKVTGAFKVMDKMKDIKDEDMEKTKKMRKRLELE
jgi:hypothetical protein